MQKATRWAGSFSLAMVTLGTLGCSQLGAIEDVGRGGANTIHNAEVRSVDNRAGRINLRDTRGQNQWVRYDQRTSVVYRQRSYPVSALERGDHVNVRVSYDRGGQLWADRIEVRESVRDRGRGTARVERVDGTVSRVDARAGAFQVNVARNRSVVVYLPRDASRADRSRLDRMRNGQRVRADVTPMGRNRYELVRFR